MRHVLRSDGLLRLEASHARVSQSGLMTGGERGIIMEVASSGSQRRTGYCDGLHWTLLPQLYRFLCIRL
jgi:hypothetical protein